MIVDKICLRIFFLFGECLKGLVCCVEVCNRRSLWVWHGCMLQMRECWKCIVPLEGLRFLLCCDCCSFSFGFLIFHLWDWQWPALTLSALPPRRVSAVFCCRRKTRHPWFPPFRRAVPPFCPWMVSPPNRAHSFSEFMPATLSDLPLYPPRLIFVPCVPLPATFRRFLI